MGSQANGGYELHKPVVVKGAHPSQPQPGGGGVLCRVHGQLHPSSSQQQRGGAGGGAEGEGAGGASKRSWMNLFVFQPVSEMVSLMVKGYTSSQEARTTMHVSALFPSFPRPVLLTEAVYLCHNPAVVDQDIEETDTATGGGVFVCVSSIS
jgi:hypothetical protein